MSGRSVNSPRGRGPAAARRAVWLLAAVCVIAAGALAGREHAARADAAATPALAALAQRAAQLTHDVALLEDEDALENLQRTYGFYVDKQLWTQAANLFADDGTIEVGGQGVYEGHDHIRAFLALAGPEYPQEGRLYDRMQLQPVIHVAADGRTAKARWHLFAQEAQWHDFAHWGVGVYENDYVKQDGMWKIAHLHLYPTMYTTYEDGWGKTALPNPGPSTELPPDRPPTVDYQAYPAAFVVPFHYESPAVTSRPATSPAAASGAPATAPALDEELAALDRRIGLLEDSAQLEKLNSIYGYYLADKDWDDLAGIFAKDGTIEIAMRGVYVGQPSVRRNLNLYDEPGTSLLHNHMQYQPVIHVAPDGQTAKIRSRAFSIMGQFNRYSMWMGAVYENDFVKVDGVWRIKRDHTYNTYFVPYTVGWKNATPRPPPGISSANPPDLPPSVPFEMYPSPFLPPFHYPNPVTGEPVTVPDAAVSSSAAAAQNER